MSAKLAAQKFHSWAATYGLIYGDATQPLAPVEIVTDDLFPSTAVEILRKRMIRHIGFNEPRNEIVVFTHRALPTSKKVQNSLPHEIDGVRITYRQGVVHTVGHLPPQPQTATPWTVRTDPRGISHYSCGRSISVGNARMAGTLGALVRDEAGNIYGLSNNHVSGACNYAPRGLPILAPGVLDVCSGGVPPFTIGFHTRCLQMYPGAPDHVNPTDNLDAAIFEITDTSLVTSYQGNSYDTPDEIMDMEADMEVEKVGRTTGSTQGRVISQMMGMLNVHYQAHEYNFSGPVYFDPMFAIVGRGDVFSDAGDSGSLITHIRPDGKRVAVGLVVAGMDDSQSPGGKLSLAIPIKTVLNQLNVSLVSGHNI
jgi:hypothetical protein